MAQGFAIFETAIGSCGIVWNDYGIIGVQLPEATEARTRKRLQKRFRQAREESPPQAIAATIEKAAALLAGEKADLSAAPIDPKLFADFNRRVYEIVSAIPQGSIMTYGEIAAKLGLEPQRARDVGQAMGENPIPIIIPCHRVLAANGKPGGYSGSGGVKTKLRLLTIEGAKISDEPSLFEKLPLEARPEKRTGK